MVQPTYLITFCWNTEHDTTVLFVHTLGMTQCELKDKTVVYLPKTNRMLLGS
jgi:hypothetical protein